MKPRDFFLTLNEARLREAIAAAEKSTSGEIRVMVSQKIVPDPVAAAQEAFLLQGMQQTRERNAILLFIAPRSQTYAVIGDEGVHTHCGQAFWDELGRKLGAAFASGDFTGGLCQVISETGLLLSRHFPRRPDDQNELHDQVL